MSSQDWVADVIAVPVRMERCDGIRTIEPTGIPGDRMTEEFLLDGRVIGFIHHAGPVFVALAGARLDRAEECGQSLSWDRAVALLVTEWGGVKAVEDTLCRTVPSEHGSGYRSRGAGRVLVRQRSRIREMTR